MFGGGRIGAAAIKKRRERERLRESQQRKGSGIHIARDEDEILNSPFRPPLSLEVPPPVAALKGILKKPKKLFKRKRRRNLRSIWIAMVLVFFGTLIFLAGFGEGGISGVGYKTRFFRLLGPFLIICGFFILFYQILFCKYLEYRKRLRKTGLADKSVFLENGVDHLIPTVRRNSQLMRVSTSQMVWAKFGKMKPKTRFDIKNDSSSSDDCSSDESLPQNNKKGKIVKCRSTDSGLKSTDDEGEVIGQAVNKMPDYWHLQNQIKSFHARELQRKRKREKMLQKKVQEAEQKMNKDVKCSEESHTQLGGTKNEESFISGTRISETSDGEEKLEVEVIHYSSKAEVYESKPSKFSHNNSVGDVIAADSVIQGKSSMKNANSRKMGEHSRSISNPPLKKSIAFEESV